jgi:hypothetical protein
MKNKRRLTILIMLSLVCLIVGLVGCGQPASETPTPPTEIQVDDFALNEIIVTGPKEGVDNVVGDPAARGLEFVTEIDLSYLADRESQEPDVFPKAPEVEKSQPLVGLFDSNQYGSLVMRLYKNLDDISTLLAKVQELNDVGNEVRVFADPNYMTDPLGPGSCGNPYSGGGSPYSGGGSPLGGLGTDIDPSSFGNQWAFKSSSAIQGGSSVPQNSIITGSEVDESEISGNGSTVGVFDTAPWTFPTEPWNGMQSISLPDGSQFNLHVSDSINRYPIPSATSPTTSTRVDIRDHGLFVAGLIKAVAPASEIFLYRVLGDDGCGSLFVLSAAIHEFVSDMSLAEKKLNNVVINLSLGVHVPDGIYYQLQADNSLPPQIAALDTAIFEALRIGAVIVAASGNDSAPSKPNSTVAAQNMQLPAFYSNVIGIAATSQDGTRSCFSNMGDVAAPGGNGGEESTADTSRPAKPCVPRTIIADALATPQPCDPADMSMCHYGVIGLSLASSTGYGLWPGTSFSAPLVSGLTALAFEKAGGNRGHVYCLIQKGAQTGDPVLGWGIINILNSLSDTTVLSTCGVSP